MKKIVQINSIVNSGSTGHIAEQLGQLMQKEGWESYIVFGRNNRDTSSIAIKIGSKFSIYLHVFLTRFLNLHGLGSGIATKKLVKKLGIINPDGSDFTGHNGGLTIFKDKIIITGGENKCLYIFDKNTIDQAENKSNVTYEDTISLETNQDYISSAFTNVIKAEDGDLLVTGEFYRDPNYKTLENHTVETCDGQNKALALAYKFEDGNFIPVKAFSIRGLVQGMAFNNNKVYLSTSWGTGFSYLYVYDLDKVEAVSKDIMGKELPLYVLDSKSLVKEIKLFPMSEEIEVLDNKLYIMNESASNKYIFGKFTSGKFCYYIDLD